MVPAPKKDPSTRARRNVAATAAKLSVVEGESTDVPEMPSGVEWHEMAVQWWSDVWSSPMSPEWDESDLHNVILCAMLYNDIWMAESAKDRKDAAGEYRLQRKDLGLTPYDRRRLEWTIETASEARDRGEKRRSKPVAEKPSAPSADPREGLRLA